MDSEGLSTTSAASLVVNGGWNVGAWYLAWCARCPPEGQGALRVKTVKVSEKSRIGGRQAVIDVSEGLSVAGLGKGRQQLGRN